MNHKLVFRITGRLLEALSGLMLLPMVVALIYRESCFVAFLISSLISLTLGIVLRLLTKNYSPVMYAKEGFIVVALAWVTASLIGSLPFVLSGEIPSFVDAFFETVSGFTTTGASVVASVEDLSHGILFWRSFTHWIGGMGVLVFMVALIKNISERSIHILRAEMPGPIVGKLVPRSSDTSKVLYIMYIAMSIIQIVLLLLGGMSPFESVVHTFGTAGTGGFGVKGDSISGYSAYCQWVITIFMLIFGVNFNLYYLLLNKRFKAIYKSAELWTFFGIAFAASTLIAVNISPMYDTIAETVRHAVFQVSTIITTTGFATADFNLWPSFSKTIMLILMIIGACAGSTAGGLKISRVILLWKMMVREIRQMIHPRSIVKIKFEGKEVDDHVLRSVSIYFAVYMLCIVFVFLLLSLEPFDMETNLSAAVSCFNNIGPGFAGVGPMSNYACYSPFSKLVLSGAMLFGRLEIFPMLIALIPSTWKKHR